MSRAFARSWTNAGRRIGSLRRRLQGLRAEIHPSPVFVLGNQKSGTTAIAALLAEMTGLSVSLDLRREIEEPSFHLVERGAIDFDAFVQRNKLDFSRELIKEPNLTLMSQHLRVRFPGSSYVFVVRDPRDQIRSILDRLSIPGNLRALETAQLRSIGPAWMLILDGSWLGFACDHYVEMLAHRWNLCADVYLERQVEGVLVRYETFLSKGIRELERIAGELDLDIRRDVSGRLDHRFQPLGASRDTPWGEFFGANLERVTSICADRMRRLEYTL